jgi:hypothetical protein
MRMMVTTWETHTPVNLPDNSPSSSHLRPKMTLEMAQAIDVASMSLSALSASSNESETESGLVDLRTGTRTGGLEGYGSLADTKILQMHEGGNNNNSDASSSISTTAHTESSRNEVSDEYSPLLPVRHSSC